MGPHIFLAMKYKMILKINEFKPEGKKEKNYNSGQQTLMAWLKKIKSGKI